MRARWLVPIASLVVLAPAWGQDWVATPGVLDRAVRVVAGEHADARFEIENLAPVPLTVEVAGGAPQTVAAGARVVFPLPAREGVVAIRCTGVGLAPLLRRIRPEAGTLLRWLVWARAAGDYDISQGETLVVLNSRGEAVDLEFGGTRTAVAPGGRVALPLGAAQPDRYVIRAGTTVLREGNARAGIRGVPYTLLEVGLPPGARSCKIGHAPAAAGAEAPVDGAGAALAALVASAVAVADPPDRTRLVLAVTAEVENRGPLPLRAVRLTVRHAALDPAVGFPDRADRNAGWFALVHGTTVESFDQVQALEPPLPPGERRAIRFTVATRSAAHAQHTSGHVELTDAEDGGPVLRALMAAGVAGRDGDLGAALLGRARAERLAAGQPGAFAAAEAALAASPGGDALIVALKRAAEAATAAQAKLATAREQLKKLGTFTAAVRARVAEGKLGLAAKEYKQGVAAFTRDWFGPELDTLDLVARGKAKPADPVRGRSLAALVAGEIRAVTIAGEDATGWVLADATRLARRDVLALVGFDGVDHWPTPAAGPPVRPWPKLDAVSLAAGGPSGPYVVKLTAGQSPGESEKPGTVRPVEEGGTVVGVLWEGAAFREGGLVAARTAGGWRLAFPRPEADRADVLKFLQTGVGTYAEWVDLPDDLVPTPARETPYEYVMDAAKAVRYAQPQRKITGWAIETEAENQKGRATCRIVALPPVGGAFAVAVECTIESEGTFFRRVKGNDQMRDSTQSLLPVVRTVTMRLTCVAGRGVVEAAWSERFCWYMLTDKGKSWGHDERADETAGSWRAK